MSTIYSYAKINLFLHIIERNKDNYHEIQSLMSFINLYDEIYIEDSDYLKINFVLSNTTSIIHRILERSFKLKANFFICFFFENLD